MTSVSGEPPEDPDTPTPPSGFSLHDTADGATPPIGIAGLSGAVTEDDFGQSSPTVLGGNDPIRSSRQEDAGDWPTLQYRGRAQPKRGRRNWFGRRGE